MKQIADDIKSGQFHKLYLLFGEEAYLKQLYLKNLLKALGVSSGDMNYTVFREKISDDEEVISVCETFPFFADRRVVLLDDIGLFKTKHDKLKDYLGRLPDYMVLIINETQTDKRSAVYKAVAKNGIAAEFSAPGNEIIQSIVKSKLSEAKKKIRNSTYSYFLSVTGQDLNHISCELEKLIAYTQGRDEITEEDIKAICSPVIENRVFEMVSAVSSGDKKTALMKYNDLVILKEPPLRILYLLARQYDQLLHIRELLDEGSGSSLIAEKLKLNPYVVKKLIPAAKRYPVQILRSAIEDMVKAEEDVKTGRLDERISVELMLIRYSAL